MEIRLIRHATLLLTFHGRRLLVDPMLADAGTAPPIANSPNPRPNPLVPLPVPAGDVVAGVDAVLVTHTHRDHWDDAAAAALPKALPLFCQPEDEAKFRDAGFTEARPVRGVAHWDGIAIHRTGGQHGSGELARRLAPVSGFVLRAGGASLARAAGPDAAGGPAPDGAADEPVLYIAGDTIWCADVEEALREYDPAVTVLNAGGAQFLEGGPITMTAEDVAAVARAAPSTRIVAVHMESINHCVVRRADLAAALERAGLTPRVAIPGDGEHVPAGPPRPAQPRPRRPAKSG
ncbi:MAG TPA: MBL fold metallo-hydrolase [bacterium]|nr:MBL fold metallo-hydrolase [bacterium]